MFDIRLNCIDKQIYANFVGAKNKLEKNFYVKYQP